MGVLDSRLRRDLEGACVRGRRASEVACRAALVSLDVLMDRPSPHLDDRERALRRGLRAKSRQLGDAEGSIALLVGECAFEQWHRLLFARFLAENDLLIHPDFKAPMTLAECDEFAGKLGEPDGWAVAARFAAAILPGIFRLDDPCVRLRLAPEGRLELERIVAGLPARVFTADNALGWVYQFWQRDKKDEINASARKIGGADLGPVTQLFTENYLVRFLLENSLGAWWASRHPDSTLVSEWDYLRFDDDGLPAAGNFKQWPERVAEVTVMDPCCGSGHFLVEAFSMLWQMRAEEEDLSPVVAQDAVLRDNLFGLELDPRCVQIAIFAVALQAWKAGRGWRELPVPHIACSGIPVKAPVDEWKRLTKGDERLENALVRLHILFRDADTLGSLIDPKRTVEITDPTGLQSSFEDVEWDEIAPLVAEALTREPDDPAGSVLGADAAGAARAADYLSRHYSLVTTNPPYLARSKQSEKLRSFIEAAFPLAGPDLATAFILRMNSLLEEGGTDATVTPQNWLFLGSYPELRQYLLRAKRWNLVARIGLGATSTKSWDTLRVLLIECRTPPPLGHRVTVLDALTADDPSRAHDLRTGISREFGQATQLDNPAAIVTATERKQESDLATIVESPQGIKTGDDPRYRQYFWEQREIRRPWMRCQGTVSETVDFGGTESIVQWGRNGSDLARPQGRAVWGRGGVVVSMMRSLPATRYLGVAFDSNVGVLAPRSPQDVPAVWAFASSPEYNRLVREIDPGLRVVNASLVRVGFDADRWREIATERFPEGLPEPWSDDPTQWLFKGRPEATTEPLQVAVGRLLGYRWPGDPEMDDLDALADDDGIVCLPSVVGERAAADRLREMLARAFGVTWSPGRTAELLAASGSKKKDLDSWLRDDFFKAHCKLFKQRPFVWHIWDGHKEGFGALLNYHRLDRATLERLTFTCLGDWIERQTAAIRDDMAGAEERLAAAQALQRRLRRILEGEPPYDIYVRWKRLDRQPLGWDPDLNDGVRLNLRPFVKAEVLRSKFNVRWGRDRGRNPDGSERHNGLHYTRAEKEAARKGPRT